MLRYMARVAEDITPETVETLVDEHFPEKEGAKFMATLAEQWEQRGIHKTIQDGLGVKFGEAGLPLLQEIRKVRDTDRLRDILKAVWMAPSLEDFKKNLESL